MTDHVFAGDDTEVAVSQAGKDASAGDPAKTVTPSKIETEGAKDTYGAKPPADQTGALPKNEDTSGAIKPSAQANDSSSARADTNKAQPSEVLAAPQKPTVQDTPSAQNKNTNPPETERATAAGISAPQEIHKGDTSAAPAQQEISKGAPGQHLEQQAMPQTAPISSEKVTSSASKQSINSEKSDSVSATAQASISQSNLNREPAKAVEREAPPAVAPGHVEIQKPEGRTTDVSAPPVKSPLGERQSSGSVGSSEAQSTQANKGESSKGEPPRGEPSRSETPKTDASRPETSKADSPRTDSSVSNSTSSPDKHVRADSASDAKPASDRATPADRRDDARPADPGRKDIDIRQEATTKVADVRDIRPIEQTIKTSGITDNGFLQPHKSFDSKPDVASSIGLLESRIDNRPMLPNIERAEIGRIADVRTTANECIVTTMTNKGKQEIDIAERGTQSSISTVLQLIDQRVYRPIAERFTSLVDFVSNFKQPDAQKFQQIISKTEDANYKRGDEIRDLAKLVTNLMNRAREIIDRNDPIQQAITVINQWRQAFESKNERAESRRKLDSAYEASVTSFTEMLRQTVESTKPMQIPKDVSTDEEIDSLLNTRFRETVSEADEKAEPKDHTEASGQDDNKGARKTYTTKSGDTMSKIARDHLNDPNLAALICKLNPAICGPEDTNKLPAAGTLVNLPTQSELLAYKVEYGFEMAYQS